MKRLLMVTSVAAVIGTAAPASADPASSADADFLSQLKAAGLTFQDPAKAIAVAKDVCDLVDKGTPDTEIESNLQSRNPGITEHGAAEFITLAAGEYCPKYLTGQGRPPKPSGAKGD
jgi:Protein of unknown function (DUF732)